MKLSKEQFIFSIILKSLVILSATIGTIISAISTIDAFMGGSTVFMYFTIQSNILIALVCLTELCFIILKKKPNRVWHIIKFVSTIAITLTGLVFSFILAPTMGIAAWSFANILTHVIVPISAIIDFFVVENYASYKYKDIVYVIIPPVLYAIYASIGYALNWKFSKTTNYPYFFLNWGSEAGAFGFSNKLPYIGVVWWILLLLLLLICLGYVYLKILSKKRIKKSILNIGGTK